MTDKCTHHQKCTAAARLYRVVEEEIMIPRDTIARQHRANDYMGEFSSQTNLSQTISPQTNFITEFHCGRIMIRPYHQFINN